MSELAAAHTQAATSTCLDPDAVFPADLTELPLLELQVLHSRITRRLELDYLATAAGAHPLTLERSRGTQHRTPSP